MRNLLLGALLSASVSIMSAGVIFTTEAPGVTQSTVANATNTVNFNSLPTGAFSGATSIGTYSSGGSIASPDQYSGDASKYLSVGAQSGQTSYTLTFNAPQTFFGLMWNALDSENSLTLFNGSTALMTFNASNFSSLSSLYKGNPSSTFHGQDSGEDFFFLNIFGTSGTTFTSVVFGNSGTGTGFESDNHTILASTVPEPSTYGMLFAGLSALGFAARRRSARKL
jgi:hypothetical protein